MQPLVSCSTLYYQAPVTAYRAPHGSARRNRPTRYAVMTECKTKLYTSDHDISASRLFYNQPMNQPVGEDVPQLDCVGRVLGTGKARPRLPQRLRNEVDEADLQRLLASDWVK